MSDERSWGNHKYIDRKRNDKGKWIYDYGNGFGNAIKEVGDKVTKAGKELNSKIKYEKMKKEGNDFVDSIKTLDADKMIKEGGEFLNSISGWLMSTPVGDIINEGSKILRDIGPHQGSNESIVGKLLRR